MSKHSYERWLLALDVRCDDAVPPAIVVRRVLKWLLRSWGLRCTGLSVDEELMRLRRENTQLKETVRVLTAAIENEVSTNDDHQNKEMPEVPQSIRAEH